MLSLLLFVWQVLIDDSHILVFGGCGGPNMVNTMCCNMHLYECHLILREKVTVKPFNLAAPKVGDFACKIILAPFILAN